MIAALTLSTMLGSLVRTKIKPPPPAPAIACPESKPGHYKVRVSQPRATTNTNIKISSGGFGIKLSFIMLVVSNLMLYIKTATGLTQ